MHIAAALEVREPLDTIGPIAFVAFSELGKLVSRHTENHDPALVPADA